MTTDRERLIADLEALDQSEIVPFDTIRRAIDTLRRLGDMEALAKRMASRLQQHCEFADCLPDTDAELLKEYAALAHPSTPANELREGE